MTYYSVASENRYTKSSHFICPGDYTIKEKSDTPLIAIVEKSIRIKESVYRYIDVDTYKLLLEMIKSLDVSDHPELRN
ncbi:hypothetical protein [Candidatus Coxiella mudrowiae]|uniref:hypothetical protein n=1 Tax=Candidatus Coxiella mudrowiae TaxID=2054173 RepID=UPI0012FEBC92|nr:hypothetical protein [Candidatus Coxiella mudrowiae]